MLYREISPALPILAPYVRFFWTLSANTPLDPQIIVPDGCPELIFHFGDRFQRLDAKGAIQQPRAFVYGQIERAIVVQPMGCHAEVLGVRFRPAGLSAFTRIPQLELQGQMADCSDVFGGSPDFGDGSDRIAVLERFLSQRLRPRSQAWREDLSNRQNRRRFVDAVGLTPKRFERIQRLQVAMSKLGAAGGLADVALEAGYFDQPHFTREFREFTGQTPSQFIREPHAISDFFTQGVRNIQEPAHASGENRER